MSWVESWWHAVDEKGHAYLYTLETSFITPVILIVRLFAQHRAK